MNLAPRIRLVHRTLLALLVVGIAVVLVGGLYFLSAQRKSLREDARNELLAIGQLKANEIVTWRANQLAHARLISESPIFPDLVGQWLSLATPELETKVRSVLQAFRAANDCDEVSLVNPAGQVLLSTDPITESYHSAAHAAILTALTNGVPALTDLHLDEQFQRAHIGAVAPLMTGTGENRHVIGAVVLRTDASRYLFPLIQFWPMPHQTAETLLVRRDGNDVVFLNELRHRKNTTLRLHFPINETNIPAVAAVRGQTGSFEGRDYRGERVLSALVPVRNSPWFLVAKIDQAEAFARLRTRSMLILGVVLGVLFALLALMGALWQYAQKDRFQTAYAAEVERRALLAHFEYLVQYANDIILLLDQDHRIIEANDRALKAYGYSRSELLGRPIRDLVPASDHAALELRLKAIESGDRRLYEVIHQRRDGTAFPVEVSAQPIEIDGRRFLQAIIRDITERKQTEQVLAQKQAELRAVYEHAPVLLCVVDDQRRVRYANRKFSEFLGVATEDLASGVACGVFGCINALQDPRGCGYGAACATCALRLAMEDTLASGRDHVDVEYRATLERNSLRRNVVMLGSTTRVMVGGEPRLLLCLQDVTSLADAQAALSSSREYLAATLRSIGDGVITTDADCRVTGLNTVAETLTGWTQDEARGRPVDEIFHIVNAMTLQPAANPIRRVLEEGRIVGLANHTVLIGRDGAEFQIADSAAPIRAADGSIAGVVMVFRDVTREYEMQEQIRESERHFRAVVESAPEPILIQTDNEFSFANPAAVELFGAGDATRLLNQPMLDRFVPAVRDELRERMRRLVETGERLPELEAQALKMDGTPFPVEISAAPFSQHGLKGALVFLHDLTLRKREEEELRANEARLEGLLRVAQHRPDSIQALLDYALDEAIQLTGSKIGYIYFYSEEKREFVLNTWSKDVLPACNVRDVPTVYRLDQTGIWGEAVRQRKPILLNAFAAAHPLKKGYPEGHVPLQRFLTIPVMVNQAIVAVVGVANKATDYDQSDIRQLTLMMDVVWKMCENRRIEENLLLRNSALEAAANGILITNPVGDILWANPAFCQITGYSMDEVLGRNPRFLKSGKQDPSVYADLWTTIRDGRVWTGELVNRRKDGSFYNEEMTITPIRDAAGNVTHFVCIKQDVTERHNLHLQLVQSQKIESVGRLAGGVAHDFNNLLQIIIGFTELLLDQPDAQGPGREDLKEIKKAADRARDLVRQLLAFSRKQMLDPKVVNLNELVERNQRMLRRLIGEHIALEERLQPGVWPIRADPGQIDQVIMNLAVNARDAMPNGGTLTLATENILFRANDTEALPESRQGRFVCLSITDTGTGMTPEVLAHLFEPFFTTKEMGKGTGLGLATIYGIIKQHDGWIQPYSELGKGSTFKIYLPVDESGNDSQSARDEMDAVAAPPRGHGERVLIVEDEDGVRQFTLHTLRTHGYAVQSASTATEALALFSRDPTAFDLALCDMVLPDGNGLELSERFCALNPRLRIVLNSGYSDEDSRWPEVQSRGLRFIQKPYPVETLLRTVAAALAAPPDARPS